MYNSQQIHKKNCHYHIRTNAHKHNCFDKILNDNGVNIDNDEVKCFRSVFKNRIITYSIENNNEENLIPENFLSEIKFKVTKLLNNMIRKHDNIKFNLDIFSEYMLVNKEENLCCIEVKSHQITRIIF